MSIYWLEDSFEHLGMMARPRGGDWLEDEIIRLKRQGIDIVVSLLESNEAFELNISEEETLCLKQGITFINFPITDRTVPKDKNAFIQLIKTLNSKLKAQQKLVVHCRMGIGRTGLVCGGILLLNGIEANLVFSLLSKARTMEMPDTPEQIEWLLENVKYGM